MILLDANIVSEAMRPTGDASVVAWINANDSGSLFICIPVLAELRFGVEKLPKGRRREAFDEACRLIEFARFRDRVLPLDQRAAHIYGQVRARRQGIGRPIGHIDAMAAAIAIANEFVLATRNTDDFVYLDINLVNPFEPA